MATRILLGMSKRFEVSYQFNLCRPSEYENAEHLRSTLTLVCIIKLKKIPENNLQHILDYLCCFPANRLVMRGQKGNPSWVSFEIILESDLRIAITKGRSYGKEIDVFIAK